MTQDIATICLGLLEALKSLLLSQDFKNRHRQKKKVFYPQSLFDLCHRHCLLAQSGQTVAAR